MFGSSRYGRQSGPNWLVIGIGITLFIVALAIGIPLFNSYTASRHRTVTICDKDVVSESSSHQYRVYTSDGTFRISDTLIDGVRFNSADTYGRITVGKVYDLTYYGWRFGLTSSFPDIKGAKLLANAKPSGCN